MKEDISQSWFWKVNNNNLWPWVYEWVKIFSKTSHSEQLHVFESRCFGRGCVLAVNITRVTVKLTQKLTLCYSTSGEGNCSCSVMKCNLASHVSDHSSFISWIPQLPPCRQVRLRRPFQAYNPDVDEVCGVSIIIMPLFTEFVQSAWFFFFMDY